MPHFDLKTRKLSIFLSRKLVAGRYCELACCALLEARHSLRRFEGVGLVLDGFCGLALAGQGGGGRTPGEPGVVVAGEAILDGLLLLDLVLDAAVEVAGVKVGGAVTEVRVAGLAGPPVALHDAQRVQVRQVLVVSPRQVSVDYLEFPADSVRFPGGGLLSEGVEAFAVLGGGGGLGERIGVGHLQPFLQVDQTFLLAEEFCLFQHLLVQLVLAVLLHEHALPLRLQCKFGLLLPAHFCELHLTELLILLDGDEVALDELIVGLPLELLRQPHLLRQLVELLSEARGRLLLLRTAGRRRLFGVFVRLFLLPVGGLDLGEVGLVLGLEALEHPGELLLGDLAVEVVVDGLHELLHLAQAHLVAVVLEELVEVLGAEPLVVVAVDGHQRAPARVVLAAHQLPPQLDDAHLAVHDLEQHPAEDVELLQEGLVLRVGDLRVFDAFSDELAQGEVVLGEEEDCELEPADLSDLHAVEPAEGIGEQFAVRGADHALEVLLAQVALLLAVEEAEERDAVEEGDAGQRFPVLLQRLRQQHHLPEDPRQRCSRFYRQHVLLVVRHSPLSIQFISIIKPAQLKFIALPALRKGEAGR